MRNNQRGNVSNSRSSEFKISETSSLLRGGELNLSLLLAGEIKRKDPEIESKQQIQIL